jgi:hypothetical protein
VAVQRLKVSRNWHKVFYSSSGPLRIHGIANNKNPFPNMKEPHNPQEGILTKFLYVNPSLYPTGTADVFQAIKSAEM